MNKLFMTSTVALAAVAFLCGCEEETTSITKTSGLNSIEKFKDLAKCTEENEGDLVYVKDSSAAYLCADSVWNALTASATDGSDGKDGSDGTDGKDGADGKNGADGKDGKNGADGHDGVDGKDGADGHDGVDGKDGADGHDGADGKDGVDGKDGKNGADGKDGVDGKDGKNGADGKNGKDGSSCTASALPDGSGYELTCGGKVVGNISNGTNGLNGSDGTGCTIEEGENGVVTLTCGEGNKAVTTTLYKAVCGAQSYDPAKQFCLEMNVYDLCDGKTFDPTKKFCYETDLYNLCDGKAFDPTKQVCQEGNLYGLCDGKAYDPAKKFCFEMNLYGLCDGETFDPTKQFCFEEDLYDLCDGKAFDPTKQVCQGVDLYGLCDGETFDPTKQFCFEADLYDLCDGKDFDPTKQFCAERDGVVEGVYKKVTIGKQTWMAENLNYQTASSKCATGGCPTNGRIYKWADANTVCPDGWRLPSKVEWETLVTTVDASLKGTFSSTNVAGKYLKATSGWVAYEGIENLDTYGFSALPTGMNTGKYMDNIQFYSWSATVDGDNAYVVGIYHNANSVNVFSYAKTGYMSVRCIQD